MKWILIIFFFTPTIVFANFDGLRITPDHFIYDKASILSDEENQELERKLNTIHLDGANSIYVFIAKEIQSQSEDSSLALFFKSINDAQKAVIIQINTREADYDLLVTKGLKEKFPDWAIEKIEDQNLKSNFKSGHYFLGLSEAIENIVGISNGSKNLDELKKDSDAYPIIFLFIVIIFFILIFPIVQFFEMKKSHFGSKSLDFVSKILLMNSFGTRGKNVFDSFSRGTGKFNSNHPGQNPQKGGGGSEGLW